MFISFKGISKDDLFLYLSCIKVVKKMYQCCFKVIRLSLEVNCYLLLDDHAFATECGCMFSNGLYFS